jgi:hypothetical protein
MQQIGKCQFLYLDEMEDLDMQFLQEFDKCQMSISAKRVLVSKPSPNMRDHAAARGLAIFSKIKWI